MVASSQSTNSPSIQIFFVGVMGTTAPSNAGRRAVSRALSGEVRSATVPPGNYPAAAAASASPTSRVLRGVLPRLATSAATAASTLAACAAKPRWSSSMRDRQHRGRGIGDALAGDVGRRAVHRLEHARVGPGNVEIAAGGQPDAAGDRRAEVGEDVAEKVVGDDDVEALRGGDEVHRRRVDVAVVDADLRKLLRYGVDGALPQATGVDQHVRLVHQGQLLLAAPAPGRTRRAPPARRRTGC